jgi:hypothetical protein
MERTQLFDLMGELELYGMKAAFDEIMATAIKRQHEPQRIVRDLLNGEINETHFACDRATIFSSPDQERSKNDACRSQSTAMPG